MTSILCGGNSSEENSLLNHSQSISLPTSPLASPKSTFSSRFFLDSVISSSSGFASGGSISPAYSGQNQNRVSVIQRENVGSCTTSSSNRSQDSTQELDWQSTKATVRERNSAMCNNDLMADVNFLVSNNGGEIQSFPAHKYVLATGSSGNSSCRIQKANLLFYLYVIFHVSPISYISLQYFMQCFMEHWLKLVVKSKFRM